MAEPTQGESTSPSQTQINGETASTEDIEMANGEEIEATRQQSQAHQAQFTPASPAGSTPNAQPQPATGDSGFVSSILEAAQTSLTSSSAAPAPSTATTSSTVPSASLQQQSATLPAPGPDSSPVRGSPAPVTPGVLPPSAIIPPAKPHGSPTRVYLNTKVTPYLLEGLKYVGKHEPEKPLKWLSEYLAKKSAEVEGG